MELQLPRFLLLSVALLLCLGTDRARSITPENLQTIINHVTRYGVPDQYAFIVSLPQDECNNPQNLGNDLPDNQLQQMQDVIVNDNGLYDPDAGRIVAARPEKLKKGTKHAEKRLLSGGNNSPVGKLKARTGGDETCLIFFSFSSPCAQACLKENGQFNIVGIVREAFESVNNNFKAFVFERIYGGDLTSKKLSRQNLLAAWHLLLPYVPLLRCDNNGCSDCSGNNAQTNPCLAGKQ